jgi:hypothetical protein
MSLDLRIEKLRRDHAVEGFDCGKAALNRFLEPHALQGQQAGAATTYLGVNGAEVVGFYSLSVGQVECADAPEHLIKGLARHPASSVTTSSTIDTPWTSQGARFSFPPGSHPD